MSWTQKVNHPSDILKKGDTVKAVVMSVDKERERLSLGLKQLTPNPWEELVSNHPSGTLIKGKVVNHADFGTFIELAEGVEGLIHISEMELDEGQSAEEAYPAGSEVTVKILNIDPEERKVSLSINAVKDGQNGGHYSTYLNAGGGGGTLGDILGESLAAHRAGEIREESETQGEDEPDSVSAGRIEAEEVVEPAEVPVPQEASEPVSEETDPEEDQGDSEPEADEEEDRD
jgi:small subunit ribosomal protein S1